MKMKKLTAVALAGAMVVGMLGTGSTPVKADGATADYVLTIPATLTVADSGWNATAGITANNSTNNFDTGKELTVTAASTNNWALKSGDNSVGYNLATATGTYSSTADPASWEFSAAELNEASGTNKDMGIIVEDYSDKPAGNYTDTVTFTATVESAAPQYADQLREASRYNGDFDDAGFWDWTNEGLEGKTITQSEALALAAYQKQQTGNNCAILYASSSDERIYYLTDSGASGTVWWGDNVAGSALNGYKIYAVNN